jgi:predicted dehydrogenase
MFELGCHLIDAAVAVLGKPEAVASYLRRTRSGRDSLADNTLAVLEYPKATCTVRSALIEVEGNRRRQFVVCGTEGTIDIRPLEPPKLLLALSRARDGFKRGYQEVRLPAMPGRYDDQLAELARIIRGQQQNRYPPEHDLAVHETLLRASDMPLD